jgi:hypothetical protein
LAVAPDVRSAAQTEVLMSYHRGMDAELAAKTAAVAASKAPPPVDAKLAALRARIEQLKQPVPIDPKLVQLRNDLEMSIQQASTRRLTAAQDVVWALINSPAFLFNHLSKRSRPGLDERPTLFDCRMGAAGGPLLPPRGGRDHAVGGWEVLR